MIPSFSAMRLFLVYAALSLWICALPVGAQTGPARPNIVYILADDLGYGDLGCYGQKEIATPHIDALARDGARFTRHYASNSVCTPSRSSLLTGVHSGRARHRDNPRFVNSYGFRPEDTTFAELMRDAGYATGIAGKWHVGDRSDTTDIAHHHGFDFAYCVGYPYPAGNVEHWPSHLFTNGETTPIPENAGGRRGRYMDDLYTDAALDFLRRNRERPFLLFLSFQGVHAPMDGAIRPEYVGRDWPEAEKVFASMLAQVDENVGRVLAELDRLGLTANTVVFFSSDNGPHSEGGHDPRFFRSNGQLRGGKRDLYEGGVRVPFIVRWPGVVKPHSVSRHVSASWDMLATFAELGGTTAPRGTDGISLVPALRGQPQAAHEFLYWENQERTGQQAVLSSDWKAVRAGVMNNEATAWSLYNLASDPGERHDIAAENPDVVRRLARLAGEAHTRSERTPLFPSERATAGRAP